MDTTQIFVGIDISKAHLDTATRPARQMGRHTTTGRHRRPGRPTRALAPSLVVLEPRRAGAAPAAALQVAGIPAAAITPARPALRQGHRPAAKTDRIDAEVLAHFAEPSARSRPLPSARCGPGLAAVRRQQPLEMQVMESNRLGSCADPTVRPGWSGTWPG